MEDKQTGICKHGTFPLLEGCRECIEEARQERLESGYGGTLRENTSIVKVRYFSDTTGEISSREYTYLSVDRLAVGDIVTVPVRDTTSKAKVSTIDVPETEILAFKYKVKTIPAGSVIAEKKHTESSKALIPETSNEDLILSPTALVKVNPEADTELMKFYSQAVNLRRFAEARVIVTSDDLRPATDDLSAIAKVKKGMEEKRKEYLRPFQDHIKETNDAYKIFMEPIEQADKITRQKILAFQAEQDKIRKEQEEINRLLIEASEREAALNHEAIPEPVSMVEVIPKAPKKVSTDMGSIGTRLTWKWELVDLSLVPENYKILDSARITRVVKAGIREISGIRIYGEPTIAVSTKQ